MTINDLDNIQTVAETGLILEENGVSRNEIEQYCKSINCQYINQDLEDCREVCTENPYYLPERILDVLDN